MSWFFYLSILCIFVLGTLTTYTDLKYHKAFNRDLLGFAIFGVIIQLCNLLLGFQDLLAFIINLAITFGVSFAFFAFRIWAAGDAKLFTVMVLLVPYQFYKVNETELFPAFFILGLVFTTALIYVFLESAYFFVKEIVKSKKFSLREFVPKLTKDFFLSWVIGYLAADTFTGLAMLMGQNFLMNNRYTFVIVHLLLITALFSLLDTAQKKVLFTVACVSVRLLMASPLVKYPIQFSIDFIFVTAVIIVFRTFTERYNYQTIPTSDIRVGQILAKSNFIFLLPSKVKDLPEWSDESTRCRLNLSEVNAIKRWENSKHGRKTVTIVRHIPFAPFIFLGTLIFMAINFYIGVL